MLKQPSEASDDNLPTVVEQGMGSDALRPNSGVLQTAVGIATPHWWPLGSSVLQNRKDPCPNDLLLLSYHSH